MFEYMKHAASVDEVKEFTAKEGVNVLQFSASWCGDCMFANTYTEKVMQEYPNVDWLYVDRDQFLDLCSEMEVMGIPSYIAFKNGHEVVRFVSPLRKSEAEVKEFLDKALSK